jgi:hypothetical protein
VEKKILAGPLTAIIDSSPVHGAGAVADTYELIRGFLVQIRRAGGLRNKSTANQVAALAEGKPDIDWQDPGARKAHLCELVTLAKTVLAEVATSSDPSVKQAADYLGKVVDGDTEEHQDGSRQIRRGWPLTGSWVTPTQRCATAASPLLGALTATRWTSWPTRAPSWSWGWRSEPATPQTAKGRPLSSARGGSIQLGRP